MDSFNDKIKPRKISNKWNHIRSKYSKSHSISNESLKRFLDKNFVSTQEVDTLSGKKEESEYLNPVVVMNARHESIRQTRRVSTNVINVQSKTIENQVKNLKPMHENKYIKNELNKFKEEIERMKLPKVEQTHKFDAEIKLEYKNLKTYISNFENVTINSNFILKTDDVEIEHEVPCDSDIKSNNLVQIEQSIQLYKYLSLKGYKEDSKNDDHQTQNYNEVQCTPSEYEPFLTETFKAVQTQIDCIGENQSEIVTQAKNLHDRSVGGPTVEHLLQIFKIEPSGSKTSLKNIKNYQCSDTSISSNSSSSSERDEAFSKLFLQHFQSEEVLMKKYFLKWIHFTTMEKIENESLAKKSSRLHKINTFLDRVRNSKKLIKSQTNPESTTNSTYFSSLAKKYQNKIKMQRDVINLQRLKLDRQERMIMELRLSRFAENTNESQLNLKEELRAVMRTGGIKHKTKAKCLQLVANLRDNDDDMENLQGKKLEIPRFLVNMQARAIERNVRHEQARERRLKLEAEKEAVKHAAEEAKRLQDEEAKKMRIEALKEKRRQEKIEKQNKEKQRQKCIENNKKAESFYRLFLLKKVGMEAFKSIVRKKRSNRKKSELFRRQLCYRKIIQIWRDHVRQIFHQKLTLAQKFYDKTIKRLFLQIWCRYINIEKSKFLVAIDWYELKIVEYYFKHWNGRVKLDRLIEFTKMKQAESHYDWHTKWKLIDHWRRLPHVLKLEKLTEERRLRWRIKIWELLPDYSPNHTETF